MSSGDTSKNISRIRTFRDDVARSRGKGSNDDFIEPVATVQKEKTQPASPTQTKTSSAATVPQNKNQEKYLALSDEIEQVAKPHKESILSDSGDIYQNDIHNAGTIIRDTKRKRFKLIPAMFEATTSWFRDIKNEYNEVQHPVHTVTKAETRASVIQKAASQSEQAPKEDFEQVAEHLKNVERIPISSTLTFKDKSEVPEPVWSSAVAEIEETEPEATLPTVVRPVVVNKPVQTENVAPVEENIQFETQPISVEQEVETERIAIVPQKRTDISQKKYAPARTQEYASFPIGVFMAVVIGASLLGIGTSYYWFVLKDAPQETAIVYKIPALITVESQVPFELPQDRIDMLTQILSRVQQSTVVSQIYPTIQDENNIAKPASVEDILQKLGLRAPGSFTRSIKELTFGSTNTAQPFIIIKATSFDVAFAGMLEWEQTQSADLFPLFGQPVVETFDSSARTDTQVRSAFFKDTIASNKNVRLLVDEKGEDRIIYTFTDQNTILITTTREALETLLPLVQ